jgi:hypothetical protein
MSHPVPTSYRVRTSFEAPASNVRSAGGIGGRSRQRHCFGFVFPIARAVDQRVPGHWRRFVEARPAGADRGRCAHRAGSPPECAAALGLRPPANAGHELRSGADKTGTSTASERYRQIARRRDPSAPRDRLHPPGAGRARACLLVRARAPPWPRPGCGRSGSCAAHCSKTAPSSRHAGAPTPTSPTASES